MHRAVTLALFGFLLLSPASAQRVITTFAGTDWLFSGDGGPAKNAPISGQGGLDVAVDSNGNYYICDENNYMVFKVTPDGVIHNFAGNGFGQSFASGDGGLAVDAALFIPLAVAVDPSGNVFITEYDQRIRKVTPDGIITTYVGTGQPGFSGDGGPAAQATINYATGLATDKAGNLYIADTGNNRIRKVTPDGIITTIAGTGKLGSVGNNVPALTAQLYAPVKLTVDAKGNIYVVETLNINVVAVVRKIDTNGMISSVAGGGLDPSNGVAATKAALLPLAVSTDPAGNLYIVDFHLGAIREVASDGLIHTVAGSSANAGFAGDGGPALKAVLHFGTSPGLAIDPTSNIFLADDGNNRIREITLDGIINTVAGNGLFRFSGNGGPAVDATLNDPVGLLGDSNGNLYIAEGEAGRIRKVASDGTISLIAGNHGNTYTGDGGPAIFASLGFPSYMTFAPDGSLVFADSTNCVVRSINPAGIITTIAGDNICNYGGDGGPATQASLAGPSGVAYDSVGNLVITDTYNHRLRVVFASSGNIFTLAGDGTPNFSGDNASSLKAEVNTPEGVRIYNGATYFADSGNNRIRKIDNATLTITTVAGNGKATYAGDGGKATAASLALPLNMNFDATGNIYIADTDNSVVRKVDTNGIISTFAGEDPFDTLNDGGLATMAALGGPQDVYIDQAGNFFISDIYFDRVRELPVLRPPFQVSTTNLAFTAQAGSSALSQRIDVTGGISGIPFTVASSATWLKASLASGNMPSGMDITADPSGLAAGSYQGTLTISAPTTATVTLFVRVAFTVTAAGQPSLSAKPSTLSFSAVINAPAATRTITVSNLGGGTIAFAANTTTTSGGSWLTLSSSSGTLAAFSSQSLVATLNPAGLPAGTYSGTVIISSGTASSGGPAQSVTLPVTMTITQVEQTLLIPQSGLTFYAVASGGAPPPQFLSILNTGRGQMPFTTRVSTVSGGNWLSAFPGSGTSDAASTVVPTVRIDVDPSSLQTGIYYGTVQVLAPTAVNNPQFVSVILNVLPPGSNIGPIVQPTGLIFTAAEGSDPNSQTVLVQNTSSTPLTFHSGITTVNGGSWLGSLPGDGTVTQAQPVRIVIQPETDGLAAGVYRGSVALSFSDGSVRVIAVVVVVIPGSNRSQTISSAHPAAARDANGCLPKALVPVFTLLSSGFNATAGFPGQVAVQVVDDCGTAMTTGDVITSFSNGDPPIRLTSLKDGNWVGTWTPQRVVSPITVTADSSIADRNLKGEVKLTGSLQAAGATPIFGGAQVVNGASFQPTLSPGSFVTLFGSQLALNTQQAPTVPLPTALGGSTIYVAGNQIPIYYASTGQVNAILPYGLAVNTTQQVLVSSGSSLSVPQGITVAAAAPGVFAEAAAPGTVPQGIIQGIDANRNATLADPSNPVTVGQTIVIYCTGLGEVTPSITAGTQTPASPLSTTVNPVTVTIGGINAPVTFAGLTPLQTGLYQVNAVVPDGVAPGNQVQVVMTAAGQSSSPVTIAVH
jgi:uncharacterized protein (TIGR03437 family)